MSQALWILLVVVGLEFSLPFPAFVTKRPEFGEACQTVFSQFDLRAGGPFYGEGVHNWETWQYTYLECKEYPNSWTRYNFGHGFTRDYLHDQLAFNRGCQRRIQALKELYPRRAPYYAAIMVRLLECEGPWWELELAHDSFQNGDYLNGRLHLYQAQQMIGEANYRAGVLPPIVPLEYWRNIE